MKFVLARRAAALLTALAATAFVYGGAGVAASWAGIAPAASAQEQGGPAGNQRGRMGKMLMSLGLSDDQKNRIREIMKQAREKNRNVTDRDQRRATMKAAFDKIHDVLTPEQRAKFDAQTAVWRKNHPQDQGRH